MVTKLVHEIDGKAERSNPTTGELGVPQNS